MRCALAGGLLWCAVAAHAQAQPQVSPPQGEAQPAAVPANPGPAPEAAPARTAAPPAEGAQGPEPVTEPPPPKPAVPKLPLPKPAAMPAPPPPQDSARDAEVAALREEVNRLQSELDAERAAALPPPEEAGSAAPPAPGPWGWFAATAVVALAAGFLLGWRLLDRRIRRKYGGLRIY